MYPWKTGPKFGLFYSFIETSDSFRLQIRMSEVSFRADEAKSPVKSLIHRIPDTFNHQIIKI